LVAVTMDTIIQDELETVPLCPILSISVRNLTFMGIKGISRIQLVSYFQ